MAKRKAKKAKSRRGGKMARKMASKPAHCKSKLAAAMRHAWAHKSGKRPSKAVLSKAMRAYHACG